MRERKQTLTQTALGGVWCKSNKEASRESREYARLGGGEGFTISLSLKIYRVPECGGVGEKKLGFFEQKNK